MSDSKTDELKLTADDIGKKQHERRIRSVLETFISENILRIAKEVTDDEYSNLQMETLVQIPQKSELERLTTIVMEPSEIHEYFIITCEIENPKIIVSEIKIDPHIGEDGSPKKGSIWFKCYFEHDFSYQHKFENHLQPGKTNDDVVQTVLERDCEKRDEMFLSKIKRLSCLFQEVFFRNLYADQNCDALLTDFLTSFAFEIKTV